MDESKPVAVKSKNNTLGTVSLVAGIGGVILFLCCSYISIILGTTALICGILGRQQNQEYALPGIILGAVAIVLGITFTIVGQVFFTYITEIIEQEFMGNVPAPSAWLANFTGLI
ncbi:MAG: DUF4190 domain-containing protein [Bacillota bacterium]